MRHLWAKLTAVAVVGLFGFAALFCCYNHPAIDNPLSVKHSCCEKTKEPNGAAKADCSACPIVAKSVDTAKIFILTQDTQLAAAYFLAPTATLKPLNLLKPVFLDGPPGPVTFVPLYIKLHSLRI